MLSQMKDFGGVHKRNQW